jgi:hypothetical protein
MRRNEQQITRPGAVLLEVLVSLTILATAGAVLVVFAADAAGVMMRVRSRESEVARANALLTAVSLWPRADLDRHLGVRTEGPLRMRIDRPVATLYTVVISDSLGHQEILSTALYRVDESQQRSSHASR